MGDPKKVVTKSMVRNINTIMVFNIFADNSNIQRLLHESEKLNSLLEIFCDLGVIGHNNSLGAHTMSAQTLGLINKTQERVAFQAEFKLHQLGSFELSHLNVSYL
jgi:hypothetical protein